MDKAFSDIPKQFAGKSGKLIINGILICLVLSFISSPLLAQNKLPKFTGVDLNGKTVNFPKSFEGRKTLVGFAFSTKVQSDLESWLEPVFYELIDTNSLASMVYDADVYLVICFNSTNISFKQKVRRELEENVLPELYANVVLTEADGGEISSELGIHDKSIPHLYTISKSGEITYYTSGVYTEKKFENLTELLEID
ncbi:MAG TPA: hypothetical protein DCX54_09955 [Flavobacteriales bacterium]|nr:hypothetical protein [Flavobacteriales bacterium]